MHHCTRTTLLLIGPGGTVSILDSVVFYWLDGYGNLHGAPTSHVDDFLWAGKSEFECSVII